MVCNNGVMAKPIIPYMGGKRKLAKNSQSIFVTQNLLLEVWL